MAAALLKKPLEGCRFIDLADVLVYLRIFGTTVISLNIIVTGLIMGHGISCLRI